jgi:polyisoprenoid-binding protein YceI
MKKYFFTLAIALIAGLTVTAQTLKVDSEKALVKFNFLSKKTIGSVTGLKAEIKFNVEDVSKSSISGTIDVTTLTTSNNKRDTHLQQEDMFNAAKFPTMDFKSTSITKTETGYLMKGEVTIKGTTKAVEIPFTFLENVFVAKLIIYSNDFEVFSQKKREDSKVLVNITVPVS